MMSHVRIKYDAFTAWCNKHIAEGEVLTDVKKKLIVKAHPKPLRELYKILADGIEKDGGHFILWWFCVAFRKYVTRNPVSR